MIQAMIDSFDRIISIELSDELFANAQWRFRRAGKVELLHGDSGAMLGEVVPNLAGPALFWLDGHYSAGMTALGEKSTPIYDELEHVLRSPERGHVIVIDDARLFGTDPDYPTFAELEAFVRARRDDLEVALGDDDSIRVTPGRDATRDRSGVPRGDLCERVGEAAVRGHLPAPHAGPARRLDVAVVVADRYDAARSTSHSRAARRISPACGLRQSQRSSSPCGQK
jgi:hypothetical protein